MREGGGQKPLGERFLYLHLLISTGSSLIRPGGPSAAAKGGGQTLPTLPKSRPPTSNRNPLRGRMQMPTCTAKAATITPEKGSSTTHKIPCIVRFTRLPDVHVVRRGGRGGRHDLSSSFWPRTARATPMNKTQFRLRRRTPLPRSPGRAAAQSTWPVWGRSGKASYVPNLPPLPHLREVAAASMSTTPQMHQLQQPHAATTPPDHLPREARDMCKNDVA